MKRIESIFVIFTLGPVIPIFLFLAGWWISLSFVPEEYVFMIGFMGLIIGCLINFICLRNWFKAAYLTDIRVLILVYLFYSIGVFGFFMGVPIFNLAVGILAGIFMGRRYKHICLDHKELSNNVSRVSVFTGASMAFISLASAYFASKDLRDTAANLRGMFKLSFTPTDPMLIWLMIIGGAALVMVQYILTRVSTFWAYRFGKSKL